MGRKSEAQKKKEETAKYRNQWDKDNTYKICIRFSRINESDIINRLASIPGKKEYLTKLIREDMRRDDK